MVSCPFCAISKKWIAKKNSFLHFAVNLYTILLNAAVRKSKKNWSLLRSGVSILTVLSLQCAPVCFFLGRHHSHR